MKEVVQGLGVTAKTKEKVEIKKTIKISLISEDFAHKVRVQEEIGPHLKSKARLTTKHQVDKSHLHPPCQLRRRGGNYIDEGSISEGKPMHYTHFTANTAATTCYFFYGFISKQDLIQTVI